MPDQPTPITAPALPSAPAAPAPAASTPNMLAAGDMTKLVAVKGANGQIGYEPVARVLEGYTSRADTQAKLTAANGAVQAMNRKAELLRADPEAYIAEAQREAARAHGGRLPKSAAPVQPNSQADDADVESTPTQGDPALRAEMRALREENAAIRAMLQPIGAERTEAAIEHSLKRHDLYKNATPGVVKRAATVVAALRVQNPDVPLESLADAVHAQDVEIQIEATTQQRNEREALANAHRMMPSANGMPTITPPAEKPTMKSLTDGSLRKGIMAAWNQVNAARAPQ